MILNYTFLLDFFIPFLFFFVMLYFLLLKSRIFGKPDYPSTKKFCGIIAFLISFLTTWYNPLGISFSSFLAQLSETTVIALLGIGIALLVGGGMSTVVGKKSWVGWIALLVGAFVILSTFTIPTEIFSVSQNYIPLIIFLIVIILIYAFFKA